jgi:hypothetical protein
MAKRNKIKKRARYNKGTRHDYRGGGRVKAYGGGFAPGNIEIDERAIEEAIAENGGGTKPPITPPPPPPPTPPVVTDPVVTDPVVTDPVVTDPVRPPKVIPPGFPDLPIVPPVEPPIEEEPPTTPPPSYEEDILPDEPVVAPETEIDVKAPTTPDAPQEYGPQDGNSEVSEEVVNDSSGNPILDENGNPQPRWYMDTVSNTWQPTRAMLAQEATYGRVWDVDTQDWVDPDVGFTQYLTDEQELSRQNRLAQTETDLEAAKKGELAMPQIQKPEMIQYGPDSKVTQMVANTKVQDNQIYQEGESLPLETVTTGATSTAQAPNAITASTYTAQEIKNAPTIDPQTGNISPEAVAGMQSQALTKAATGVTIEDETANKVLADRVVGVLSDGALASEQAVKGLNLPKVLRAKQQLRNSGLTEAQITEIGNDPEALEARLMEFTEQERGMIEGLPEEALVSNQMNSLLTGLDNGEVPTWARPAVSAVNQMLAQRGLDASTVGRDALFNAIIQSAMPLAQQNAQAIQQSVSQQKGIEAQAELQNAQMRQQTALTNASNVFNMNMAQFSADQQTELANSKFLQTATLTNASNEQQAVIQEAASLAQLDLATLDSKTKLSAQNAQAFLTMDMQNLSNRQQGEVLNAQMNQQRLLSNQAATNAALKFNATSEMQTDQFMTSLSQQTRQFNSSQTNAMEQFNAQQNNAAEARRVQNQIGVDKADAAMKTQIDQFNSQQDYQRNQWNAQNSQAVQQADMKWRRQLNTANTAAINAVNQQNAQNAFGLSSQAQAFMWQELRDQADYAFRSADNYEQRKSNMYIAMLGNESGNYEGSTWDDYVNAATPLIDKFLGGG